MSELRSTWTAGEYPSAADPSTSGVTEGFGLMFYNARWLRSVPATECRGYDPALGRFAQADTLVPAGVQGLDRYAYVNNAPTRFTDPSGHRCVPANECDTPHGDIMHDVPLTNNGDLGACSRGNCDGKRMQLLYQYYLTHPGFWNNYDVANGFTPQQFLAFMLMAEAGGDPQLLDAIMQAAGVQIGSGVINANGTVEIPAYCPGSTCINGVFNFLAAYSQSAWGRYNAMIGENYAIVEQPPVNYNITSGSSQLSAVAATMVTLYSIRHSRTNDLPTNWGVYYPTSSDPSKHDPYLDWMVNVAGPATGTTSRCGIYYMGGGSGALTVVYTANQEYNWTNGNCR